MSKSPNPFLLPALGGTAVVLGTAIGVASYSYGTDRIALLEARVLQLEEQAGASADAARAAAARAEAESARAAELEARLAGLPVAASERAPQPGAPLGLGRAALDAEIAAWDVDVLPDGRGLPEGRGDVWTGEELFASACASCHGDFAEGRGNWPVLAGGFDTLDRKDPVKTVGSYWPYLSTVWDYVHRSMPFGAAQTLEDDEVYAITAYILYSNDLVDEDFELSHENFLDVEMHNTGGFVLDDRPEREYAAWRGEPCMENCKESVTITMRASVLDVTPQEEVVLEMAAAQSDAPQDALAADPVLVAEGAKVFRKCQSCHQIGAGAQNRVGPQLTDVMGRAIGAVSGFSYSQVFEAAAAEGRVWTEGEMAAFLAAPKDHMKGTRMAFAGLRKEEEIAAVIAYLKANGG